MYNYFEAMKEDILTAITTDYYSTEGFETIQDELLENGKDATFVRLNDDLWIDDSVTGNGSGSYTFNYFNAKECVTNNVELCREALREFCADSDTVAEYFLSGDWEYFDVTIRCYLLGPVLWEVLEEIEAEMEAA